MVLSETSSYYTHTHTHTSYFRHISLKNFTRNVLAASQSQDRPTFVECCSSLPTCLIVSSICSTRENRESLYDLSLPRQERVTKTEIFQLFKNALEFYCLNKNEFMNVLNFKFLFLTFPAEAQILCMDVQLNNLKCFKDWPWCGSLESIFYPHIVLQNTFGTSLKHFW